MARSTVESLQECDVTQPSEEKLDFDEDTLRGEKSWLILRDSVIFVAYNSLKKILVHAF